MRMSAILLLALMAIPRPCLAQDRAQESVSSTNPESLCRFALALPEKEGPFTLGIFSPTGELVRLLYRDASIENIPAGLNGLLISWDGKDDSGMPVPDGTYNALGLVHGKLSASLPQLSPDWHSSIFVETNDFLSSAQPTSFHPFPSNRIIVLAARDALFENEKRPQLSITAQVQGKSVLVSVEGLPLYRFPLGDYSEGLKTAVELHQLSSPGEAKLSLISPEGCSSIILSGLDQLVPLHAGSLPMPPNRH
jgi:hypothetical protein